MMEKIGTVKSCSCGEASSSTFLVSAVPVSTHLACCETSGAGYVHLSRPMQVEEENGDDPLGARTLLHSTGKRLIRLQMRVVTHDAQKGIIPRGSCTAAGKADEQVRSDVLVGTSPCSRGRVHERPTLHRAGRRVERVQRDRRRQRRRHGQTNEVRLAHKSLSEARAVSTP